MGTNSTQINESLSTSATVINESISVSDTVVNPDIRDDNPNFTVVNPTVQNYTIDVPVGTLLANKYEIKTPLSTNTGEANLYLCEYRKHQYVAKVYRRQTAIKKNIVLALENINSPFVAKIYETGSWNNAPFEIIPYYQYGSLEGKTFSFESLRKNIIPALNAGLHALHKKQIIHKDLKPSNIMLNDDQKSVAIIDFGISSIREGGNTVVVTKTGMTPEYSAPETFRNLFLEESDYYSLGITLYELYCGHTPYAGATKDLIEQYIAVQKIPFPNKFPPELKRLITGLTYSDITNRKDKENPNRRWTYEEVKKWCAGEAVALPGGESELDAPSSAIPPFTFQYKRYTRIGELVNAMGLDWDNGKKRLYRSLLTEYLKGVDQELASYCMDAEDAVRKDRTRQDIEFYGVLYKLYPQMKAFHWCSIHYNTMQELGEDLLSALRGHKKDVIEKFSSIMRNRLFSVRESIVSRNDKGISRNMAAIETKYLLAQEQNDKNEELTQLYLVAYYYSCAKDLITSFGTFYSTDELSTYVKKLLLENPDEVDKVSKELITTVNDKMSNTIIECPAPQFAAWLFAHGKTDVSG